MELLAKSEENTFLTDLADFISDLSSAEPVPGGGSVAALEAAMSAALLVMVCNLTIGRKRYADVEQPVRDIQRMASECAQRAQQLVDEDIAAFRVVAKVMAMPKDTEHARMVRAERMQAALKAAVAPPLDTINVASTLLDLASQLAPIGNRSAISDVGTAAGAAQAAFDAALLNVEINLAALPQDAWSDEVRHKISSLPDVKSRAQSVSDFVLIQIRS